MKLQIKLLVWLLGGLLSIYFISFLLQESQIRRSIDSFSAQSRIREEATSAKSDLSNVAEQLKATAGQFKV